MDTETRTRPGTVVGRFDNRHEAEHAVERLRSSGYAMEHVGFLGHDHDGEHEEHAEPRNALAGAASGSLAGGVVGGLIGAATTALIPGIGPIVSAGILAGIVAGAPTGAVVGGVAGALRGAGVHEDDADHYEREFRDGRTLVVCRAEGHESEVAAILREAGGDVESPISRAVTEATGTAPEGGPGEGGRERL